MKCSRCQHDNRAGARFCEQCAAPLARLCSNCGTALPDAAKFCPQCAHPVNAATAQARPLEHDGPQSSPAISPAGERRQATVLFADISGYTTLCASMDPEHVQALLGRFYALTDSSIQAYGGHVIDHAGDGVVAVFGAPVAYGNDGERAVRAAVELHREAARLRGGSGEPLRLHIGIASGEVVAAVISGGAQPKYAVTGDTVNLAARLDALAQSGETMMSEALHETVSRVVDAEALGEVPVKGFDKPLRVWKVRGLRPAAAERGPFIGRHNEMRQLTGALDAVLETAAGLAICVRGEPGIGKTRLIEELHTSAVARGYTCHIAHVLDFGVGKGQDAVAVIVRDLLEVTASADETARRSAVERGLRDGLVGPDQEMFINDLLDVEQPPGLQAVFDAMDNATRTHRAGEAVAAVLKRASSRRPRLVVVEDIHWASGALLRHCAQLTVAATESPAVLVMTSRVEGDPLDKVWRASTQGSPLMTIDLGPLRPEEARLLAGGFIEASNRFAASCIERAEGNPLFLEQLLRNVQESETANIPPTIQSLVLARMDRLKPRDKQALQAASVVGKRFTLATVRSLIDDPQYGCEALLAGDLVRPEAGDYRFAHALIQEGVYSSLLNSKKRELHGKAAAWFGPEEPILRAEHLDRAEDPAAAQAYLDAATDEARRFRYDTALRLAERGLKLALAGPERYGLTVLRGELLREIGLSQDSIGAFRAALALAEDDAQRCRAWMGVAAGNRVTGDFAAAMEALSQAEHIAQRLGLLAECSRIRHTRGNLYFAQGKVSDCHSEHHAALAYARQIADPECEAHALSGLGDAQYAQGRMLTARDYFSRCVDLCQRAGLVRVEIPNRTMVSHCLLYKNELDRALSEAQGACDAAHKVGLVQSEIFAQESLTLLLLMAGRYDEAEQAGIRCLSLARPAGARRYQSAVLYVLAVLRVAQGNRMLAREHLAESLELARQTGMGFLGAAIFGALAYAAEEPAERRRALEQGEALLREPCVGHCHLWFYWNAIDAALAGGEWDTALRYARALEDYVRAEPLPWAGLIAARGRALASVGRGDPPSAALSELGRLRVELQRAGLRSALPAIDAVLDAAKQS
ncbi:MAG TPA: adenylate/guanylate cyclase domain-containing protein [Burkholderiales bacterium]|nr:adenylate/guanylate cyclase domain-containing protein [Burkholderiales bacterium]